jgi:hypothetical protein
MTRSGLCYRLPPRGLPPTLLGFFFWGSSAPPQGQTDERD